jgi:2-polyprenyl-6-hydroxyphenyl methylase/3-demethylubiquinone-9 3-methyltransferase
MMLELRLAKISPMLEDPTGAVGLRFADASPMSSSPYLLGPVMNLVADVAPNGRVFDVGCGNGYWAGLFAQLGHTVVGIDPSRTGIEIARATYPAARFEQMVISSGTLAELGEAPFDLVVSTEVVEHLYDPPGFAASCFAALRPGGRILISTPFHGWVKDVALAVTGKLDKHHDALRVGGHIKFFSRSTLEQLLLGAGFCNARFVGAGRLPHLWKSIVVAADRPPSKVGP